MDDRDDGRETELIREIARGNHARFEEFYRRYVGVLFATAFGILHDGPAAEDVVQEVCLQVWDKAALYDERRGKLLTWVVTLARNRAIDRLRAGQRRTKLHDAAGRDDAGRDAAAPAAPAAAVESAEHAQLVRDALGQLAAEQREVIELAFFSGLTHADIAARLGQPLGTVKARIRRGLLRLRDLVGAKL